MRSFNLLLAALAMSLAVQTASAQRATLAVSARILPSLEAMAAGQVAPTLSSGHTVTASARLSAVAPAAPATVLTAPAAVTGSFVEFSLGMVVSTNVQYQVASSSGVARMKVQPPIAGGRREITFRVPSTAGSQTPTSVTLTLTAASIS